MITIDNRIFIPFIAPFAILLTARALYFVAGATWSNPDGAATAALFFGMPVGAVITIALFIAEIDMGTTRIGWRRS